MGTLRAWQTEQIGLDYRIMATLGCSAAERLLRAYLRAIRDSNRANREFARVLESGPRAQARIKAKVAAEATDRLQAARQAFQLHKRRHRC